MAKRDYLVEAAKQIRMALDSEVNEDYEAAFSYYKNGVDLLLNGVQCKWVNLAVNQWWGKRLMMRMSNKNRKSNSKCWWQSFPRGQLLHFPLLNGLRFCHTDCFYWCCKEMCLCWTVDPNKERREAVKRKTTQYLKRAEEIFITHLQDNLGKGSCHLGVRLQSNPIIYIIIGNKVNMLNLTR